MLNSINIFKKHQAQTFPYPSCLEIKSSSGSYILDANNKNILILLQGHQLVL